MYIPRSAGGSSSEAGACALGGSSFFSPARAFDSGSGAGGDPKGFGGGTRSGGVGGTNVGMAE